MAVSRRSAADAGVAVDAVAPIVASAVNVPSVRSPRVKQSQPRERGNVATAANAVTASGIHVHPSCRNPSRYLRRLARVPLHLQNPCMNYRSMMRRSLPHRLQPQPCLRFRNPPRRLP
jgi:hypothetical protein